MKVLRRLTLVGFSSFVVIIVLESILRVFFPQSIEPIACRMDHPIFHHSLKPNSQCRWKSEEWDVTFQINKQGLRNNLVTAPKEKEATRVIVLGNSFVEGWGVKAEDRFTEELGKILAKDMNRKIEVINMGVAGYSLLLII